MTNQTQSPGLNICMLLPMRYKKDMLVYPSVEILSYVTRFGHKVTWVIGSEEDRQVRIFRINDIQVHAIPYRSFMPGNSVVSKLPNMILNTLSRIRQVLKIFRREKFDVVLVRHQVWALDGLVALYIKQRYKIPLVLELPNPLDHWDEIKLNSPRQKFIRYCIARVDTWFSKRLVNRADLILPISQWLTRDLNENMGVPESHTLTIPEGVDLKSYVNRDPAKIRKRYHLGESPTVVYEGEMNRGRKLEVLIKAFARVVSIRPGTKLLMVGDGNDRMHLQQLTAELGIIGDVIFTGYVAQSEIPDFIAASEIGVSPINPLKFYTFSSPIKMLEYLASAKPAVANEEIPDHRDVLERSSAGILVPFNPEAFANAIVTLLDNPGQASAMGQKGREWVVNNRSYEVLAYPLAMAYGKLVSGTTVGMPLQQISHSESSEGRRQL